jgi:ankyrin repeat protein
LRYNAAQEDTPMRLYAVVPLLLAANACRGPVPHEPIAVAASQGDVAQVRQLLTAGSQADATDIGITPLMSAARRGDLDVMTTLLDAGADVNRHDTRNGWTPLMHALHKQQRAAVTLLLRRGADPNTGGPDGQTPLMMATLDNDLETIDQLLVHGAHAGAQTITGATALDIAVSGGALVDIDRPLLGGCYPETVKRLLAADPTLTTHDGYGPLSARWWARMHGCDATLALIAK